METVTGKLIQIVDICHIILEDSDKKKYFIGVNNLINEVNIGKIFTCSIISRFHSSEIIKKNKGKYKFLYSIKPNHSKIIADFYYFKNNKNNKIIEITLNNNNFNNGIIGENYDLKKLTKNYKGLTVLPFLPENENKLYSKVLITKKNFNMHYEGILNNKTISISSEFIKESDVGINVLIELLPKFLSTNVVIGNNNIKYEKSKLLLNLELNNNYFVSNIDKSKEQYIMNLSDIIISNNNIGKKIITSFNNLVFIQFNTFKLTNNENDYKLIEIKEEYNLELTGNNIYYFLTKDKNIITSILPKNIIMDALLGKYFSFNYLPIYYLKEILPNSDDVNTSYLLFAILKNNIYLFSKNNIIYCVNINQFVISSSSIGKSFNILINNYILIYYIYDIY